VSRALPAALLLVYGIAFGHAALGGGLLVYDDHPGQLYRLHHALTFGAAPWRFDPGWWAGYAELQFYPPGLAWLGWLLHQGSWSVLGAEAAYRVLLWLAWLLPGLTTLALLSRLLGNGWLALPGAFIAMTLSAGSRSGVEEGLRWGLVAARLGWSLLPLLGLSLARWVEGRSRLPLFAAPLLAAVILLHPAHAPAAFLLLVMGAWLGVGGRRARMRQGALVAALGLGLAALWLLPLLAHLRMALPLAWGDASPRALLRVLALQPLVWLFALGWLAAWISLKSAGQASRVTGGGVSGEERRPLPPDSQTESATLTRWILSWAPALVAVVALDALVAAPLGLLWLPADRLMDGLLLALLVGASLALSSLIARLPRLRPPFAAAGAVLACIVLSGGSLAWDEPSLSLWPRRGQWPKYEEVARGSRLDALWQALREAPPGRALFLRSGLTLEYRPEWWRPHTHLTALTPLRAGRDIINGTFTHPAPVAGFFYTGSAASRPITTLVERRDGVTLFGQPLEAVSAAEFAAHCARLKVSAVVATDEDVGRLAFLEGNQAFTAPALIGPFRVYLTREPRPLPVPVGLQVWRLQAAPGSGAFTPTGFAYSPLMTATAGGAALRARRDGFGMLEVERPPGGPGDITLTHTPGWAEWTGVLLSTLSAAVLMAVAFSLSPAAGIRMMRQHEA
jgi:hypothetical protein